MNSDEVDGRRAADVDGTQASANATTALFRAVSHAEFADVTACGMFRQSSNSYANGKFFAESGGDALQWGRALEGAGNFRILEVEFTQVVADRFMRFGRLDGIGPARFGGLDELGRPAIRLWHGSP
jgi:hypothetical protein